MATNIKSITMILQTAPQHNAGIKEQNHLELHVKTSNNTEVTLATNNATSGKVGILQNISKAQATQFAWNTQDNYWKLGDLTLENISSWSLELIAKNDNASYNPRTIWVMIRDVNDNNYLAVAAGWNKGLFLPSVSREIG